MMNLIHHKDTEFTERLKLGLFGSVPWCSLCLCGEIGFGFDSCAFAFIRG